MTNRYQNAAFITSVVKLSEFPPDEGAEVAFAGRSNAGKSSAINAITGRSSLARASKTPGRTQRLNFFRLDDRRRLVDLPGYGYARAPVEVRRAWASAVHGYLARRSSLKGLMVIMDIRRPLTELDEQLLGWCRSVDLPAHIVLTKADKLGRGRAATALLATRRRLQADGDTSTSQLFSATAGVGVDQARGQLDQWLHQAKKSPGFTIGGEG